MSALCAEKAQVLIKTALLLLLNEFAVFSKFGGEVKVEFLLVGIVATRAVVASVTGVTLSAGVVFIFIGVGSGVVVVVGALALIVGALRLWSGWSFPGHFEVVFPVTRVDGLGEGMEVREGVGFADAGDLVLDLGWELAVQLLAEGGDEHGC